MRAVVLPAAILAAALAAFLWQAPGTFAARAQAHGDLLARERDLLALQRELSLPEAEAHEALRTEHARLVAELAQREQAFAAPGDGGPRPRLDALLAAATGSLAPGGSLHEEARRLARLPAGAAPPAVAGPQERALARLLEVVGRSTGPLSVDSLELTGDGEFQPLPRLAGWRRLELRVAIAGALPDLLRTLEQLAPGEPGPAPWFGVTQASLRRIEPAHWGAASPSSSTPPLRLTLTLDALFPPGTSP